MYIFVVRFLLISVMKLVEGAIYYLIEYMCIISLLSLIHISEPTRH